MDTQGAAEETIRRVTDAIWSFRLPAPHTYFGHSYAYLIQTAMGPVLIDTGEAGEASWTMLLDGVARAGYRIGDIHAVLLTHSHYDHCGAAGRIKRLSGAWIGMSAAEAEFLRAHPSDQRTRNEVRALCLRAGATEAELPPLPMDADGALVEPIEPDVALVHGLKFDFGDTVLRVVMTEGHSPGHASFLVEDRGIFFAGDHLFPHGSTVVMLTDADERDGDGILVDPFGDYLHSLERCALPGVSLVLPGHIGPFGDLVERAEVERQRYQRRLTEVSGMLEAAPAPPAALARRMRWGKGSWDDLPLGGRQLAIINTVTCLRALERLGQAIPMPDGRQLRYARVGA